jgi:hypothetical protein
MIDQSCKCGHPRFGHGTIFECKCIGVIGDTSNGSPCDKSEDEAASPSSVAPWIKPIRNIDTTATTTTHDPVSAPSHYTRFPNGVQPIDLLEHLPFNLGAAGKYILRAGHKGPAAEDIRKAIWFLERELKRVSK